MAALVSVHVCVFVRANVCVYDRVRMRDCAHRYE